MFTAGGSRGEGAALRLQVELAETGAAVVGWGKGERSHCGLCVLGKWIVRPVRVFHCCFGRICSCDTVVV